MPRREWTIRKASSAKPRPLKAMVLPELVGLILASIVLVTAVSVIYRFGPFLYGGGREQTATDSFNSLTAEILRINARTEPFIAVEKFPYTLGDDKYSLIGFDAGGNGVTTKGIGCIGARTKPIECGSKACICLFDPTMKIIPKTPQEQATGIIRCQKIDGISTISAVKEAQQTGSDRSGRSFTTYGTNLGAKKDNPTTIKGLTDEVSAKGTTDEISATNYLFILNSGYTICSDTWLSQEAVSSQYKNGPLYLERTIIDGKGHIVISPSTDETSTRMNKLQALIGITHSTVQAKTTSGDLTGAIKDSKAWLETRQSLQRAGTQEVKQTDIAAMMTLQGQAFQKISELEPRYALTLLEKLEIKPPIPDKAEQHAGLYTIKAYKAAIETIKASSDQTKTAQDIKIAQDMQSSLTLDGLKLSQKLQNYLPEIKNELLPYFRKESETTSGGSASAMFLKAKEASERNDPAAIKLLTDFIQSNPDDDLTREARFILAGLQEKNGATRDALTTHQQIKLKFTPPEQTMSDGRRLNADDEINRICTDKIATEDIYDICIQLRRGTSCPTPTLAVLPKEACAQNLIDENRCAATPEAVYAFVKAQELAAKAGKTLEIVSAYRTIEQQQALYDAYLADKTRPEAARPSCEAPHVTGKAIDVRFKGEDMGAQPFNDMTHPNRKALEAIMCQAGFTRWKEEYWHYEIGSKRATEHPAKYPTSCSA